MSSLQSEWQRLYGWPLSEPACTDPPGASSTAPADRVRSMVMALTPPPHWQVLARVWRGLQSELGLPAPAIAVAGGAGLQLWFSWAEPVALAQALAFIDALRLRYLPDVDASRVHGQVHSAALAALMPAQAGQGGTGAALPVPAELNEPGRWSAFVAADLVAVFDDTPWLDVKPSDEGQAALLRGLATMARSAFEQACQQLGVHAIPAPAVAEPSRAGLTGATPASDTLRAESPAAETDPRRFLLQVMNDSSVALALRIEAAKALLQHRAEAAKTPPA